MPHNASHLVPDKPYMYPLMFPSSSHGARRGRRKDGLVGNAKANLENIYYWYRCTCTMILPSLVIRVHGGFKSSHSDERAGYPSPLFNALESALAVPQFLLYHSSQNKIHISISRTFNRNGSSVLRTHSTASIDCPISITLFSDLGTIEHSKGRGWLNITATIIGGEHTNVPTKSLAQGRTRHCLKYT